jgi:hypothetical protein
VNIGSSRSALKERKTVRDRLQEKRLVAHRGQGTSLAGSGVAQTGHAEAEFNSGAAPPPSLGKSDIAA